MPRVGEKRKGRCHSCGKKAKFTYIGYTDGREVGMGIVHQWNCSACGSTVVLKEDENGTSMPQVRS